jgi:hypothetical protein
MKKGVGKKRAQASIFIVLALAIVVILALLYVNRDSFRTVFEGRTPLENIQGCIQGYLDEGIETVSVQGGSIDPENFYMYEGYKVDYVCYTEEYYELCVMQKPLLKQSIEQELQDFLKPRARSCLNAEKENLEGKGYSVSMTDPNITVDLVPNNVLVNIKADLKIRKDKTETYEYIKIDTASKLYELVMIASSITSWEGKYGDSEILNYMFHYPDLKVEKKKQGDGSTIYILTDKKTQDKFLFAVRSMALPPGLTGN